jgi:hypothetical protein
MHDTELVPQRRHVGLQRAAQSFDFDVRGLQRRLSGGEIALQGFDVTAVFALELLEILAMLRMRNG